MSSRRRRSSEDWQPKIAALPKAELHLHLEGAIAPETVLALAARHGVPVSPEEVAARYAVADFAGFLDTYRWVTALLRQPSDYEQIARELFFQLRAQNVLYAEVTVSVGVMLRRGQDVEANFAALERAAAAVAPLGLRVQWIFDAVRQFGGQAALEVARWAVRLRNRGVVAFGVGGDELGLPARELLPAYTCARQGGLHAVIHAGEIGGPESVREAAFLLEVERVGHGLALVHDPSLARALTRRGVTVELCPTSNLRTGALARQCGRAAVTLADHPLPAFFRQGLRLTLATDDPAIFQTTLLDEYALAHRLGLSAADQVALMEMGFQAAFLPAAERDAYCQQLRQQAQALGLL